MRELPEPEGFSVDTMFTESRSTANNYSKGATCPVSEWWDRDQVLAIQKQAYEDGLKDALFSVNTTTIPVALQYGWDDAARLAKEVCADSVQTLLTASQEKK